MKPIPEERHQPFTLPEPVPVITIPDGKDDTLPAGTIIQVTQTLGTSYTIKTERGTKYRVAGILGPAIGQAKLEGGKIAPAAQTADAVATAARRVLMKVYDPEIPVDIVNLGLVHELKVEPEGDGFAATVRMGLTSPGCGMGDVLVRDVREGLLAVEGIKRVDAQVVLFPVWNPHTMMSDAAKLKLGLL